MVQCSEILGRGDVPLYAPPRRKALRTAGAAWALALLLGGTGCGQKGALYLPQPTTTAPTSAHTGLPTPLHTDTTLSPPPHTP